MHFWFLLILPLLLAAEGQIDSSFIQSQYEFSGFTGVSVSGSVRIKIMKSANWNVRVFSSREDRDSIKIRLGNDLFYLRAPVLSDTFESSPVLVISMPQLCCINLDGPVQMEAGGFSSTSDLNVSMGSGSYLNLNGFEASAAEFELNGPVILHAFLSAGSVKIHGKESVSIRIGGRAGSFNLDSEGSVKLDGTMFLVDHADLTLNEKSEIRISPDSTMMISAVEESLIYYNGEILSEEPEVHGPVILRKY